MQQWYVYILTNKRHGVLYIGITNNLARRVDEHISEVAKGFTEKYHLHRLVYYEVFDDPSLAIQREKNLKSWQRDWKIRLIEETNPTWKDLSSGLLT